MFLICFKLVAWRPFRNTQKDNIEDNIERFDWLRAKCSNEDDLTWILLFFIEKFFKKL